MFYFSRSSKLMNSILPVFFSQNCKIPQKVRKTNAQIAIPTPIPIPMLFFLPSPKWNKKLVKTPSLIYCCYYYSKVSHRAPSSSKCQTLNTVNIKCSDQSLFKVGHFILMEQWSPVNGTHFTYCLCNFLEVFEWVNNSKMFRNS